MTTSYPPNIPYFNGLNYNSSFYFSSGSTLTQQTADQLYLKYPISQSGTEILSGSLNVIGGTTLSSLSITDGSNTLSITPTSIPATSINITSDNSATTCYLPFIKTTAGTNKILYVDDTTGPLSYNPSTATLSVGGGVQIVGVVNNSISSVGNTRLDITSGTGVLALNSGVSGNILIGATGGGYTAVNTSQLILSGTLQTSTTSNPSSNVLNLGYHQQILGSSFTSTLVSASTNTNLASFSFTSANYGTYLFTSIVALSPTDQTVARQMILAISQVSASVANTPFVDVQYSLVSSGYPYLKVQAVIPIYAGSPTVYLVGYCFGTGASVQTINSLSHFSCTRIA